MTKEQPKTGLDLLRTPFPANQISKLPKPTKAQTDAVKANFKAGVRCQICGAWHHPQVVHLDYVGHAALTDRLLNCDPQWNWEPVAVNEDGAPKFDGNGGMWIRLTVCGVTRLGYGHADGKRGGDAIKESIGDALRNAAMRFGAALDLWHKGELHIEDTGDDPADKPPADTKGTERRRATSKAEDEIWGGQDDENPFGGDRSDDPLAALAGKEIAKIKTITSLDELKSYWTTLDGTRRDLAMRDDVKNAKDERKAELLRNQRDAA